jgi:hypothetical protein
MSLIDASNNATVAFSDIPIMRVLDPLFDLASKVSCLSCIP